MIVIAALIGGMLMPAQIMAQNNRRNEKPRVENRGNKKEMRISKDNKGEKKDNFRDNRRDEFKPGKPNYKPGKPDYRPNRPPVVVVNRPAPRPCPPPPPRNCYYDNDAADAVVAFASIVALMSLMAD